MSLCPKDGKPCCDDLCHGAGCLEMDGYRMLDICFRCKGTIDHEIPDCGSCTCDPDEDFEGAEDAEHAAKEGA